MSYHLLLAALVYQLGEDEHNDGSKVLRIPAEFVDRLGQGDWLQATVKIKQDGFSRDWIARLDTE